MICSECQISGELKVFHTFQYYYCKSCKKEINLKDAPKYELPVESQFHIDDDLTIKDLLLTS